MPRLVIAPANLRFPPSGTLPDPLPQGQELITNRSISSTPLLWVWPCAMQRRNVSVAQFDRLFAMNGSAAE